VSRNGQPMTRVIERRLQIRMRDRAQAFVVELPAFELLSERELRPITGV
jgi:hypothetical protein